MVPETDAWQPSSKPRIQAQSPDLHTRQDQAGSAQRSGVLSYCLSPGPWLIAALGSAWSFRAARLRRQEVGTLRARLPDLTATPPKSGVDQFAVELAGPVLDEVETVLRVAAHQLVHQLLHRMPLLVLRRKGYADQRARVGAHGRLAELLRVHFPEPLEAADFDLLALEHRLLELGAVRIALGV